MPYDDKGNHIPAQMKKCIFCGRRTPIGTKCCTGNFVVVNQSGASQFKRVRKNPHGQYARSLQLFNVERAGKNR